MEKYQAVNRIQKRETLKRISTERDQKVMSRLTSKEKRNEDGTAKNDAAVAVDFDTFFSDLGPDPQSDKPNSSFLSKSQKKEFERIMNEASRGRVSDAKFKRIAKFQKDIEKKRERAYGKKQADIVSDKLAIASNKAQTDQEKAQISAFEAEYDLLEEEYKKASRSRKKEIQARRNEISNTVTEFNQGIRTQAAIPAEHTFATSAEAEAANLPVGTRVRVGDRTATVK
jgi:hypothetical protein